MTFDLRFWLLALLAIGFCWPSEGAIQGDGLLWAAVTCGVSAMASLYGYGDTVFRSRRKSTWAVLLLLSGFAVSTGYVFAAGGNRRAALNLLFEWLSLGGVWYLTRIVVDELRQRQAVAQGLLVACFCVAAFGIVQHYVLWPGQQSWYQNQVEQAASGGVQGQRAEQRLRELGVPAEGPERRRFEDRLMNSTEALGPFALANTLGGILAVGCVLLAGGMLNVRLSQLSTWHRLCLVAMTWSLLWGLVLTKSRTAWIAASVGILVVVLRHKFSKGQQLLKWGAAMAATAVVLACLAALTGAIDREVIFESPKSLQYRLLYWAGTVDVISDSVLVGTGPGNFREAYLRHKWPETSEEILDPHNVFLDLWCTTGLIGLISFVGMLWLTFGWLRADDDMPEEVTSGTNQVAFWKPILAAVVAVKFWDWLQGGPFWDSTADPFADMANLLWALPLVAFVISRFASRLTIGRSTSAAAFGTLVLHLCASGGMQITVMGMLLLVLFALAETDRTTIESPASTRRCYIRGTGFLTVSVLILFFGLKPDLQKEFHLRMAASHGLNLSRATAEYEKAAQADPFDPESRQRQAVLYAYAVEIAAKDAARGVNSEKEAFRKLVRSAQEACDKLQQQAPAHRNVYRLRASIFESAFEVFRQTDDLTSAILNQRRLIECYPSSVQAWLRLSRLLSKKQNPEQLKQAVQETWELEQINRNWGHSDRYLPSEDVDFLQSVLAKRNEE